MSAFATRASHSASTFGNVASVPRSPFASNPSSFGVPSPAPFGSSPSPFGGNNAFTTNSGHVVSFAPSSFGSSRPSLSFGGNAFTTGTLCNTSLGSCQASNHLTGGTSVASYRATNESDCPKSMMQSISTMSIYANKSHEELRHEDYQMNNKGRPISFFGSFGVTRTPNNLSSVPPANLFALPSNTTPTPNNAFYDAPPTNLFSPSPSGPPKPSNPFSVPAPLANPFSPSISPFGPPKTSNPFFVPSANDLITPRPQGLCFPPNSSTNNPFFNFSPNTTTNNPFFNFSPNTTTPAFNGPLFRAPSTNFPACMPTPVGNINWGPFAPSAQPLPENNVEAKSATPTVSGTPCKCCSIPANPEVVSTTNPSQPSQASSSSTTVKEVGSQDKNGQQNTVASTTQPETVVVVVQNGSPSKPVETVLSVGLSSLSIWCSPTEKYDKGKATENKARPSFRVSVDCIDIDDVSSIMPKLPPGKEYYTEPSVEQLEAMERAEPGYCSRVKDFVVGRKDKGSIKFLGETDVRELDLESIVQFNDREVVVYLDETKMPPAGQGLNKPAEVTLLNVKCISKLTGKQYIDGPQLRKYEEKLMEKAAEIGGEFISFDPVKGQWNFRVSHI